MSLLCGGMNIGKKELSVNRNIPSHAKLVLSSRTRSSGSPRRPYRKTLVDDPVHHAYGQCPTGARAQSGARLMAHCPAETVRKSENRECGSRTSRLHAASIFESLDRVIRAPYVDIEEMVCNGNHKENAGVELLSGGGESSSRGVFGVIRGSLARVFRPGVEIRGSLEKMHR